MRRAEEALDFSLERTESSYAQATVHVSPGLVSALYRYMLYNQQSKHRSLGFSKGNAPIEYIEQAYSAHIMKHLKEFLFNYCVADFLVAQLRQHQCVLAEKPTPDAISIDCQQGAFYTFLIHERPPHVRGNWRRAQLALPRRKRYKDIDRQVQEFLQYEIREESAYASVQVGDWLLLRITVIEETHSIPLSDYVWLKMGSEETDRSAHNLFLNQKPYSCFLTSHTFLEQYFSEQLDTEYPLAVEIIDRLPVDTFSLRRFQHHFQLKQEEIEPTLTQVFSYRHDISQRREIIDKVFKHLFKHFHVSLNEYLIERQRKHVLEDLAQTPDYHVYKAQSDFEEKVYLLAKKQLKETIIIDHIMQTDNMTVTEEDIRAYCNLFLRPRTKSFIYFNIPRTQEYGQEVPISHETIRQACLREKTLNYVIRTIFQA